MDTKQLSIAFRAAGKIIYLEVENAKPVWVTQDGKRVQPDTTKMLRAPAYDRV